MPVVRALIVHLLLGVAPLVRVLGEVVIVSFALVLSLVVREGLEFLIRVHLIGSLLVELASLPVVLIIHDVVVHAMVVEQDLRPQVDLGMLALPSHLSLLSS